MLLTKREVKMAGYWPSSFFCVFMDQASNAKMTPDAAHAKNEPYAKMTPDADHAKNDCRRRLVYTKK